MTKPFIFTKCNSDYSENKLQIKQYKIELLFKNTFVRSSDGILT